MTSTASTMLAGPGVRSILKPPPLPPSASAQASSASALSSAAAKASAGALSTSSVPPFKCEMRYQNRLPEIPFDPKFFSVPLPPDFLSSYSRQSTLERHHKWRVHVDAPQTTEDQVADIQGEEEYGRGPVHEEDLKILRKEGDEKRSRMHGSSHNEAKSWLQRPVYLQTVEKSGTSRSPRAGGEYEFDGDETWPAEENRHSQGAEAVSKEQEIVQEFKAASELVDSLPPHPQGLKPKAIYRILPNTNLAALRMHMVRFMPATEPLGKGNQEDDDWRNARSVLVKRQALEVKRTKPGPNAAFDPLTLLLPKRLEDEEEEVDDLFMEEKAPDAPKYDARTSTIIRDYNVVVSTDAADGRRLAVQLSLPSSNADDIFSEDTVRVGVASFAALQRQSLKLARSRTSRSSAGETEVKLVFPGEEEQDEPGDDDEEEEEEEKEDL